MSIIDLLPVTISWMNLPLTLPMPTMSIGSHLKDIELLHFGEFSSAFSCYIYLTHFIILATHQKLLLKLFPQIVFAILYTNIIQDR